MFGFAFIDYSNALLAGVTEISVKRTSGKIKVNNFWCCFDCRTAVLPDNVIAQTQDSVIYGLGLALSERISIKGGDVEQSDFYDYQDGIPHDVRRLTISVNDHKVNAADRGPQARGKRVTRIDRCPPAIGNLQGIARMAKLAARPSNATEQPLTQVLRRENAPRHAWRIHRVLKRESTARASA